MTLYNNTPLNHLKMLEKEKKYEEAVAYGEKVLPKIKNKTQKSYFLLLLGMCYYYLNDIDTMLVTWRKVLNVRKTVFNYEMIINALCVRKKFDIAEEILEEARALYPGETRFINYLLMIYSEKGEVGKAIYSLLDTDRWELISSYARTLVIWDILEETDMLAFNEIRKRSLKNFNMLFCFTAMNMPLLDGADLRYINKANVEHKCESILALPPLTLSATPNKKIKIGYLSADFYLHATMQLLFRVLELHSSEDFEIELFYLNDPREDEYAERLESLPHKKHYLADMESAEEMAKYIAQENIDILVDLKGYTKNSKIEILAYRPAKVIVNWLGFPGTLGHERLADYIIGDPVVTPLEHKDYYSETLALMPYTYQPNDDQIDEAADSSFTRAECGLPEDKLVFCSFNQIVKLNPQQFDFWCMLLNAIPDSVLWLLTPDLPFATQNILKELEARGIDSSRLMFAESLPLKQHIQRLKLADIALDSFPCTSHTTASDAMRAGVPLVAQLGNTFPARVSASIVHAMGLPHLIATNVEEAFNIIYNLAQDRDLLNDIKKAMREHYKVAPLYNAALFTRDLERLYKEMWRQYQEGKKEPIVLEPLPFTQEEEKEKL